MKDMDYQIIGENEDGSVTVRMFINDKAIDETFVPQAPKTKEDQVREYVQTRLAQFASATKLKDAIKEKEVEEVK